MATEQDPQKDLAPENGGEEAQSALDNTVALIACAQQGDLASTERLLNIIKKEHMPRQIRRFAKRNVLVSQDEIESAFLEGCWRAIKDAKLDVGNPLMFICWKGQMKVLHLFRRNIREGVKVDCPKDGIQTINYVAAKKKSFCSKCGADAGTFMIVKDQSQMVEEGADGSRDTTDWDRIEGGDIHKHQQRQYEMITYDIWVQEIRASLGGRTQQLFDKLVIEQINTATSKNYLQEIATEWGVTTACVSVYLRKLRARVAKFYMAANAPLPPRLAARANDEAGLAIACAM